MIGTIFHKSNPDDNAYFDAAVWCDENRATIEDKGDYYEVVALPDPTLDELKNTALTKAKRSFAKKRDAIRWVNGYGYDCAAEDITNFMAAYTPLLVQGAGAAQYKVWLTEQTKGIITLSLDDMTRVYHAVRTSQLEAYAWYETIKAQLESAQTEDELAAVLAEAGLTESAS